MPRVDVTPAYFPAFLRLAGCRVLVVGGGEVALRKVRLLRRAAAHVEVVARELHAELAAQVAAATTGASCQAVVWS